jgi:hypothetical protein
MAAADKKAEDLNDNTEKSAKELNKLGKAKPGETFMAVAAGIG